MDGNDRYTELMQAAVSALGLEGYITSVEKIPPVED